MLATPTGIVPYQQIAGPEPSRAPRTMELTIANLEAHNSLNPGAPQSETWVPTEVDSNAETERLSNPEDQGGNNNQPATYGMNTAQESFQQSLPAVAQSSAPALPIQSQSEQNPPSILQRIGSAFQFGNPSTNQQDNQGNPPSLLQRLGSFAPRSGSANPFNIRPGTFNETPRRPSSAGASQAERFPQTQPFSPSERSSNSNQNSFNPFERFANSNPFSQNDQRNPPSLLERLGGFGAQSQSAEPANFRPENVSGTSQTGVSQARSFPQTQFVNPFEGPSNSNSNPFHNASQGSANSNTFHNPFERFANSNPFQASSSSSSAPQQQPGSFSFSFSNSSSGMSQEVPSLNGFERPANSNSFQFAVQSSTTSQQQANSFSFNVSNSNSVMSANISPPPPYQSPLGSAFDRYANSNPFLAASNSLANVQQPAVTQPTTFPPSSFDRYANINPFQQAAQAQPSTATTSSFDKYASVNPFQQVSQTQHVNPFAASGSGSGSGETGSSQGNVNAFDQYADWNPFRQQVSRAQHVNPFAALGSGSDEAGSSQGSVNAFDRYADWNPFRQQATRASQSSAMDTNELPPNQPSFVENSSLSTQNGTLASYMPSAETWYQQQGSIPGVNPFFQSTQPLSFPFRNHEGLGNGSVVAQTLGFGSLNPFLFGDSGNPLLAQQFNCNIAAANPMAAASATSDHCPEFFASGSYINPESFLGFQQFPPDSQPGAEVEVEPFVIEPIDCQDGFWTAVQHDKDGSVGRSEFDLNSSSSSTSTWTQSSTSTSTLNSSTRTFKPLPRRGVQVSGPRFISSGVRAVRSKAPADSSVSDSGSESESSSNSGALGKRKATEWQGRVDLEFTSILTKRQALRRMEIEKSYEQMKLHISPPACTFTTSPIEPTPPATPVYAESSSRLATRTHKSSLNRASSTGGRAVRRLQTRTPKPAVISSMVQGLASVFARFSFS